MAEDTNIMNNSSEQTVETAGTEQQQNESAKTFTQSELNAIVERRLAQQARKYDGEIEKARSEGKSEAERLAKMTEDQRADEERKTREDALLAREREITRRELRAQAMETLTSRGLPNGLEAILDYADAGKCAASIDAVEKAFRAEVQKEVDKRLAQGVSLTRGKESASAKETDGERMVKQMNAGREAANKRADDVLKHYKFGGR